MHEVGVDVSPEPAVELARPLGFAIELALWAAAAAALAVTGHPVLAVAFAAVAVASGTLDYLRD